MFQHGRNSKCSCNCEPAHHFPAKTQWLPELGESLQPPTWFILQQLSRNDDCVAQRKYAAFICINHHAVFDANFDLYIDNSPLQPRVSPETCGLSLRARAHVWRSLTRLLFPICWWCLLLPLSTKTPLIPLVNLLVKKINQNKP